MLPDTIKYSQLCDKFQRFSPLTYAPYVPKIGMVSRWSFYKFLLDTIGPMPLAVGQKKFLIVKNDHFTQWIKSEALNRIREEEVVNFLWKKIMCLFSLPRKIVTYNGGKFICNKVKDFVGN